MGHEVEIGFRVTQDGEPFHQTQLTYANVPYPDLVEIERIMVAMLGELVKFGETKAKLKKR